MFFAATNVSFIQLGDSHESIRELSASDANDVSCFLVERDDLNKSYHLKTIFDLDQAYFSARLITRPDREWLDP